MERRRRRRSHTVVNAGAGAAGPEELRRTAAPSADAQGSGQTERQQEHGPLLVGLATDSFLESVGQGPVRPGCHAVVWSVHTNDKHARSMNNSTNRIRMSSPSCRYICARKETGYRSSQDWCVHIILQLCACRRCPLFTSARLNRTCSMVRALRWTERFCWMGLHNRGRAAGQAVDPDPAAAARRQLSRRTSHGALGVGIAQSSGTSQSGVLYPACPVRPSTIGTVRCC